MSDKTLKLTADLFENDEQALRHQNIVLRDSLGNLAIQLLFAKEDVSNMEYDEILRKLYTIIDDLHTTYQQCDYNFSE
jgi:hypothetical protein